MQNPLSSSQQFRIIDSASLRIRKDTGLVQASHHELSSASKTFFERQGLNVNSPQTLDSSSSCAADSTHGSWQYSAFIRRFHDCDITSQQCPKYYFTLGSSCSQRVHLSSNMILEPSREEVKQLRIAFTGHLKAGLPGQFSFDKIITLTSHKPSSPSSSSLQQPSNTDMSSCEQYKEQQNEQQNEQHNGNLTGGRQSSVSIEFDNAESFFLWHRLCRFALANLILSSCYGDTRDNEVQRELQDIGVDEKGCRPIGSGVCSSDASGGKGGEEHTNRRESIPALAVQRPVAPSTSARLPVGADKEENTGVVSVDRLDRAVARCGPLVSDDYPLLQRARAVRGFKLRLASLAGALVADEQVRWGRSLRWWNAMYHYVPLRGNHYVVTTAHNDLHRLLCAA